MTAITRRVKAFAETTFGVRISRTPGALANKHADEAIRTLRRWSSTDVVFDVGANDGRTVLRIQEQLAEPRIFAFEPVRSTYEILATRTAELPNVRTFRCALGAAPGSQPIYVNPLGSMNSFAPDWVQAPTGTELVEIRTLDDVSRDEGVEFIHFLKIDTEGYELEVLRGAERMLGAGRVAIIQLEVGFDQLPKRFLTLEDARRYLAARGYLLRGIFNQCLTKAQVPPGWSPQEGDTYRPEVLAYCDALFIRADL